MLRVMGKGLRCPLKGGGRRVSVRVGATKAAQATSCGASTKTQAGQLISGVPPVQNSQLGHKLNVQSLRQ